MESETKTQSTYKDIKTFDQKNWISENLGYKKDSGSWAWIFHRITGIALIAYLFLHVYSLSPLTKGEAAFNAKMAQFSSPIYMAIEWFLFAFVIFHSLNRIRIGDSRFGPRSQVSQAVVQNFMGSWNYTFPCNGSAYVLT